jgi:fructose-specific component phosphotransferase system IIB-like protein
MAFSIEEKVDLLLKKVAFGKTKTDRSENTDGFGESIASPLLLRADKVMKDAGNIPSTPAAVANVVEAYQGSSVVACSAATGTTDTNITDFKRAWTTGHTDWIPPEFSAAYTVEVYVGPSGWNGTDAIATTIGGTNGTNTGANVFRVVPGVASANWYFDYQAGVLYWTNESGEPSGELTESQALTSSIAGSDIVYIKGYKYIGNFGVGGTSDITGGASTIVSADLTIDRALISNGSGKVAVSAVTSTELSYLDGVTSAIQTQLNGKQATITGAATTIDDTDLTASRAVVSDGSGKIAVSAVTSTELGYLDGVTSAIQTQLNGKQATITGAATTIDDTDLTASRALVSDGSGKVAVSAVTSTELGYLDGVTSAIQTQLNGKQATITGAATTIDDTNLTASRALVSNASGKVAVSAVTDTELALLDGATADTVVNSKAVIYGASGEVSASSVNVTGNVSVGGSLTVQGDFIQETSTNVIFEDTFLDLNVPDTATADITTDSGFRFGTGASVASTLDKHAQLMYDATNDLFKFTREADAGNFSPAQAKSGADNVAALKFTKSDTVAQTDQPDALTTMPDGEFANAAAARSLGAVAKCQITITSTSDGSSNFAPDIQGSNGYVIKHNLNTQSIYVVAIKDPSGTPIPIFCKYAPIDANSARVTVGVTADNEVYDIIVIG